MQVSYREQLIDLMKELRLPLDTCLVGVGNGTFASILMSRGMRTLYLVDEWKESLEMDEHDTSLSHDNYLQMTRDRMTIYGNRTEKYLILQGTSAEIAPHFHEDSISMLYLDKDDIVGDLKEWYDKVRVGGIVATGQYTDDLRLYSSNITMIMARGSYTGAYFIKH